ncbi:MAG: cyclase family protein [Candidatus Nitrosotenuis sp.]
MKPLDLTLTISEKIPMFPGSPQPYLIPWDELKKDGYNLEMLFFSTHTGTHVDAPYHFLKYGKKLHQIDPSRFLCNVTLIKIKSRPNYTITKSDIVKFEKRHGAIPRHSSVVFATSWNDNMERRGFFEQNPGLADSAAKYLVSKKTNLVGIDAPSIDAGKNSKFSAHHILLAGDVLILENLCNLHKIRSTKFRLAALPLKLQNATGSPVRAVAF